MKPGDPASFVHLGFMPHGNGLEAFSVFQQFPFLVTNLFDRFQTLWINKNGALAEESG